MRPNLSLLIIVMTLYSATTLALPKDNYNGLWWNEDRSAIFELVVSQDSIEGITRWGDKPDTDSNNPDPALRSRSLKDITFLWGFEYEAKHNRWKNGKVYDPDNGKTYDAKMELNKSADQIEMRGYMGIAMFGRTATFSRVKEGEVPEELKGKSTE